MKKIFIVLSICLGVLLANSIQAQLFSDEPIKNVIPLVGPITLTIIGSNLNSTFSTISDYSLGINNYNAVRLRVTSTKPYHITALATTANFSTATTSIVPCSKLWVSPSGFDNFQPLSSTTPILLFTSFVAGTNINHIVDYWFNPGFGYKAGAYTLSVMYTATQD